MKKIVFISIVLLLNNLGIFAQTKVIAHRGFWDTENSVENSITSLYKAHEAGCYGAEFDVHATSDGRYIVFHDNVLNGMTISETSYEKLRDQKLPNGEIIPTLEQYLVHSLNCPDIKLILEFKTGDIKHVKPILKMIEEFQLQNRTEYISFNLDICKEVIKQKPNAEVAYLSGNLSPVELKELGFTGIDYHYSAYTKNLDLVNQSHEQGLVVNAWTVNDPVMMKRLIGMGVEYITTDKPLLLQQMIKEYAQKYTPVDKPQVDLSQFPKNKKGYITLFDGSSFKGWRGYAKDGVPDRWILDEGAMKFDSKKEGTRGDIIFAHKFKNFELELEWKVSENANSGIFYLIQEIPGQYAAASAPEAQVLDNKNHADAKQGTDGNRQSMSLYDLIPAKPQNAKPFGQWNKAKIRVENGKVSHYQNGKKVVEYTLFTPEWVKMLENSKFSVGSWDDAFYLMSNCGGINREGYIGFQDHGDDVWFRNVKIKPLEDPSVKIKKVASGYAPQGPVRDMVLIYDGGSHRKAWDQERFNPYVYAPRQDGSGADWVFDGFLFLEIFDGQGCGFASGYRSTPAKKEDWLRLIDGYLLPEKSIRALDNCIEDAKKLCGKLPSKRKIVIALPEPIPNQKDWGTLDGKALDFSVTSDRIKACEWYIDYIVAAFKKAKLKNVELAGFYWLAEEATHTRDFVRNISDYIHKQDQRFYWIPYFKSDGFSTWRDLGFDQAYLQPNHFFNNDIPDSRIDDACALARQYGMSMEFEFDRAATKDKRSRMQAYIDGFIRNKVFEESDLAYYEGGDGINDLWKGTQEDREMYYQLINLIIKRQK